MSDAQRPGRATTARGGAHPAKSTTSQATAAQLPCAVAALLRGQPELALLSKSALRVARLEQVDDRLAVVATVLATQPGVVVLPPFDVEGTSTFPLVLRVRREAPGVAVLLLATHPSGAGQPLLRAAHAGASVVTSPTSAELREELVTLLGTSGAGG